MTKPDRSWTRGLAR